MDSKRDHMRKARKELINRMGLLSLKTALDCLLDTPAVISHKERDMVLAEGVTQDKVRFLIDILVKKGELACERFLDVLEEVDPALFEDISSQVKSSPVYSPTRPTQEAADKHFIDKNFSHLVKGVSNVDPILDRLLEKHVISQENYYEIRFRRDNQAKMRALLELCRRSARAKDILCEVLMSIEPFLMNELNYQDFKHKVSMKEQSFPMEQVEQGNRRTTDSEAAASTSSAHLSDASDMGCEYCAEVPDTGHWVLVQPEVSTEKNVSTYSLSSDAGSYECSLSGLRWSCSGPIKLQYFFMDAYIIAEELAQMKCKPAGPLMDIKIILGKLDDLDEIHLPHFLCLGGSQSALKDAVKVLHKQDSGVSLEACELTRHHAKIVKPSLSLRLTVCYYMNVPVHCELLLFCTTTSPLKFHVYLVPKDPGHIQSIHQEEKNHQGKKIRKPGAVGQLRLDACVLVHVKPLCQLCKLVIQPVKMELWPLSTSNYCEVYMEHPDGAPMEHPDTFDVEVVTENGRPVCKRTIHTIDLHSASGSRGSICQSASKYMVGDEHFIEKHHIELIQRVRNVGAVLDRLLSKKIISQEIYSEILRKPTWEAQMREILGHGNIHGSPEGKDILYEALVEEESFLMGDLNKKLVK